MANIQKVDKEDEYNRPRSLPEDVIEDNILSRLPVKSLMRFRCVSKHWRSLLTTDSNFIQNHLSHSVQNLNYHKFILQVDGRRNFYSITDERFETPVKMEFPDIDRFDRFYIAGCSNGLICLSSSTAIYLWNPSRREHTKLPPPLLYRQRGVMSVKVSFGFDPISKDYKVLRLVQFKKPGFDERGRIEVEIYSLNTDCWRKLGEFPYIVIGSSSKSVINGVVHWLAGHRTGQEFSSNFDMIDFILAFDMFEEVFREISLPPTINPENVNYMLLRMVRGCLSISVDYRRINKRHDIWVMMQGSWAKLFTIEHHTPYQHPIEMLRNGEILVCKWGTGRLLLYNSESKKLKELQLLSELKYPRDIDGVPYVESLVPVLGPGAKGHQGYALRHQRKKRKVPLK